MKHTFKKAMTKLLGKKNAYQRSFYLKMEIKAMEEHGHWCGMDIKKVDTLQFKFQVFLM